MADRTSGLTLGPPARSRQRALRAAAEERLRTLLSDPDVPPAIALAAAELALTHGPQRRQEDAG